MSLTGISFTKDKRLKYNLNGVPGPGQYKIPIHFANVPDYLIPNREEQVKYIWYAEILAINLLIKLKFQN